MQVSELFFYDFLKEKIKLSDSDARRYTKELFLSEEIKRKQEEEVKRTLSDTTFDSFDRLFSSMKKGSKQVTILFIWALFWLMVIFVLLVKY